MANQLKVVMTLDDRDFTVRIVKAGQTVSELKSNIDKTTKSLKDGEAGLGSFGKKLEETLFKLSLARYAFRDINDIVLALPKAFITAGGEVERTRALLEGLSKETDQLKRKAESLSNAKFIFNFAQNAPFEVKALTDLFVKLKTAGIDPTNGSLAALTGVLAKFGANDDQVKRVGVAIQQMSGKGVISLEELRQQLGEAVPNAIQLFAAGSNKSIADFTADVAKGTVASGGAIRKFLIQAEIDSLGASERLKKTLPGLFSSLATELELFKIKVSEGGAGDIVKQQVAELISFFKSADGKKFAEDIGSLLKSAVQGAVALKDGFIAIFPVLKTLGGLYLLYLAGSKASEFVGYIKQQKNAYEEVKQKLIETRKESVASSEAELNRIKIARDAARVQIKQTLPDEENAQRSRIAAAQTEYDQQVRLSKAKIDSANIATSRAGVLYAEAIKYQRAVDDIDNSGLARQGKKRENFAANATAYKQETIALQQQAVALRQDAQAAIAAAEAKLALTQTDRSYIAVAAQANAAIATEINNLNRQAAATAAVVAEKQRLLTATSIATNSIREFGATIGKTILFSAAIGIALEGFAFLYDKIAGASKRAADSIEKFNNLRNGQISRENIKGGEEQVSTLDTELKKAEAKFKKAQADRAANVPGAEAEFQKSSSALQQAQIKLNSAKEVLELSKQTLVQTEAISDATQIAEQIASKVSNRLELSDLVKQRNIANGNVESEEARKDKDKQKGFIEQRRLLSIDITKKQREFTVNEYASRIGVLQDPAVIAQLLNQKTKALAQIDEKLAEQLRVDAPAKEKSTNVSVSNQENKESALFKLVQKSKADFEIAKISLSQIGQEVNDYVTDAQNKTTFRLLQQLADGDFDINDTKAKPGVSPNGKTSQRKTLIDQFRKFLDDGSGSALDFIEKLGNLDVTLKNGEESVRSYFKQLITNAGLSANSGEQIKGLTSLYQKQASSQFELNAVTAEFNAGLNFLPPSIISVGKELEAIGAKAKFFGASLEAANKVKRDILANTIETDQLKRLQDARTSYDDSKIKNITDSNDRERAQYDLTIGRLNKEYGQRRQLILDTIGLNARGEEAQKKLEEEVSLRRTVIQDDYFNKNKSQLRLLGEEWANLGKNIDDIVANTAKGFLDNIANLVTGAKTSFGDLIKSFLNDFTRVQIQQTLGPLIQSSFSAVGDIFRGFAGIGAAGTTNAQGVPLNASKTASLVEIISGDTTQIKSPVEAVNTVFQKIKESTGTLYSSITTGLSAALGFLRTSFTNILSSVQGSLPSLGGISNFASGVGTFISSFFADGGIMSSKGSLPLNYYRNGGVASSPQLAVFGEGKMNEAYVPLPDGRSIPVSLSGGQGGGGVPVTVNVINQTSQPVSAKQGNIKFDGRQMILDVVLNEASRPGPFRDQMRQIVK